jgi:hypothetical protein
MAKLKNILQEVFEESPKVDKYKVVEGVRNFSIVGKQLYNNNNIVEIAKQLSEIAESAHHHILGEQDDWFDKISINKNMKSLKGSVMEFQKTAKEAHQLNQRMTALYEDIGHVLNRYYDIDEVVSEDKGDMDNDGVNEPDDEEYLDNKDKAIKQAISKESVGDSQNMDQVDRPDSPAKDGRDNENEALDRDKTANGGGDEDDLAARDGEEMQEIKRSLKDVGGVVGIPSLGAMIRNK